jgi:preprotein translocase subunit SecD
LVGGCAKKKPFVGAEIIFESTAGTPGRVTELLGDRVEERGLVESQMTRRGTDIVVRIAGLDDELRERVTELLQREATLTFQLVAADGELIRSLAERVAGLDRARAEAVGLWTEAGSLLASDRTEWVSVDEARRMGCFAEHKPVDSGKVECWISGNEVLSGYLAEAAGGEPPLGPDGDHVILGEYIDSAGSPAWRAHHLERTPVLSGRDLVWAELALDIETQLPLAVADLTPDAVQKLAHATREHRGRALAVVLDEKIHAIFTIDAPLRGHQLVLPIAAGPIEEVQRDAMDLVSVLRAGIPLNIRLQSSRTIGRP